VATNSTSTWPQSEFTDPWISNSTFTNVAPSTMNTEPACDYSFPPGDNTTSNTAQSEASSSSSSSADFVSIKVSTQQEGAKDQDWMAEGDTFMTNSVINNASCMNFKDFSAYRDPATKQQRLDYNQGAEYGSNLDTTMSISMDQFSGWDGVGKGKGKMRIEVAEAEQNVVWLD
jgi:hypothetical protein